MGVLESVIEHGNRGEHASGENIVKCQDGFSVSVVAGSRTYCTPRPPLCPGDPEAEGVPCDYPGPYSRLELGFPSERPEPWDIWQQYSEEDTIPLKTVYKYVPVLLVRELVRMHGGEVGTSGGKNTEKNTGENINPSSYIGVSRRYVDGYLLGRKVGYLRGHEEGYEEGNSVGYEEGRSLGYGEGRDQGFSDGIDAAREGSA